MVHTLLCVSVVVTGARATRVEAGLGEPDRVTVDRQATVPGRRAITPLTTLSMAAK